MVNNMESCETQGTTKWTGNRVGRGGVARGLNTSISTSTISSVTTIIGVNRHCHQAHCENAPECHKHTLFEVSHRFSASFS